MTDNLRNHINEAMTRAADHLGKGRVADYIPALAKGDPAKLGFALALPDGTVHASGDADEPFSIQSVSKVFTLALALRRVGSSLWDSVGREPSGSAFNSIVQLESEQGIPRKPLINAGALATTDRLIDGRRGDGKSGVGGGILCVAPGQGSIAVWSPGLNEAGTSLAGAAALEHFAYAAGWSVFD